MRIRPRHRTSKVEGGRIETFLRRSLHMSGSRRVVKFFVIAFPPADHVVLFFRCHGLEPIQVMDPLLNGNETASVEASPLSRDDGSLDCGCAFWILSSILIARKVKARLVPEAIDLIPQLKGGGTAPDNGACSMDEFAAIVCS